jgi:hypothetical protein
MFARNARASLIVIYIYIRTRDQDNELMKAMLKL